jgi:Protein of unknown function (DUF3072)
MADYARNTDISETYDSDEPEPVAPDEPMTDAQADVLKRLCEEAYEPQAFDGELTETEARALIDDMRRKIQAPQQQTARNPIMSRDTDNTKPAAKEAQHGVVQDERGQDQPADKKAAQTTGKPSKDGLRAQKEAAKTTPMSPGQPSGGE